MTLRTDTIRRASRPICLRQKPQEVLRQGVIVPLRGSRDAKISWIGEVSETHKKPIKPIQWGYPYVHRYDVENCWNIHIVCLNRFSLAKVCEITIPRIVDPDSSQIIQPQWRFAVARAESDFGSGSWSPVGGPQVLLVDHLGYNKLLTYRTALQIIYIYINKCIYHRSYFGRLST